MSDTKLSNEQWEILEPLLPPQPPTGRRREHDREVLNSIVYRLKTGVRYGDIPKTEEYAARSTVYYWLKRWSEEGVWEELFQELLGMLDREGKLNLEEGALDGSFVPAKRGVSTSTTATKARGQLS
jgi:putative transposase